LERAKSDFRRKYRSKGTLTVTGTGSFVNVLAGKGYSTTQGGTGKIDITDNAKMTIGSRAKVTMNGQMTVSNGGTLEMSDLTQGLESHLIVHRSDLAELPLVGTSKDGLYLSNGGILIGTGKITGNVFVDNASSVTGDFRIDNAVPREYSGFNYLAKQGNMYNHGVFETSQSSFVGLPTGYDPSGATISIARQRSI
jgi:hypothetical protein